MSLSLFRKIDTRCLEMTELFAKLERIRNCTMAEIGKLYCAGFWQSWLEILILFLYF